MKSMTVQMSDTRIDDSIDNGIGDGVMIVNPMENRLIPPPSPLGQQLSFLLIYIKLRLYRSTVAHRASFQEWLVRTLAYP